MTHATDMNTYEPEIRAAMFRLDGYIQGTIFQDTPHRNAKEITTRKEGDAILVDVDWNLGTDHARTEKTEKFINAFEGTGYLVEKVGSTDEYPNWAKAFRLRIPDTLDAVTKLNTIS